MHVEHVLVDPIIFAVPNSSGPAVERYLDALQTWARQVASDPTRFSTSERAVTQLVSENRFPTLDVLRRLIAENNIVGTSAVDVASLVSVVAGRRPYIEDRSGIRDIVLEQDCECDPSFIISRVGAECGLALLESIIGVGIALTSWWSNTTVSFGTVDAEGAGGEVLVRGRAEVYERLDGECGGPVDVALELPIAAPGDTTDVGTEWTGIYTDVGRATRAAFDKYFRGFAVPAREIGSSSGFVESLVALGLHRQQGLLERVYYLAASAWCEVIQQMKGAGVHPVRVKSAADSAQVERDDGAKLWRCTVTKRGAGYRMHYWNSAGGIFELERVMVESDV